MPHYILKTETKQEFREEFKKCFGIKPAIGVPHEQTYFSPDADRIADFWLSKLDQALKEDNPQEI